MEITPILSIIAPMYLIAIGVLLIALEALFYSFILIWFGIAFILVGLLTSIDISTTDGISSSIYTDGLWQLASVGIIALILLLLLRSRVLNRFLKPSKHQHNDDFLNTSGIGEIHEGRVYFKGTYWEYHNKDTNFKDGESVQVISTQGNTAIIEKLPH